MSSRFAHWPCITDSCSGVIDLPVDQKLLPRLEPVKELLLVSTVGALLVLLLSFPALDGFFFAEDFTHWGSYEKAGRNFWVAVFSPHDRIFFRPAIKAFGIVSNGLLPPEPWAYHLRNWLLTAVVIGLLYSLIRRLTASRTVALAGLSWFLVSKVHLTTLGYILMADVILNLLASLAALYFLVRHLQTPRRLNLALSYLFFALAALSRDYGVVVLAPIMATWLTEERRKDGLSWRRFARGTMPYVLIAACYLAVRIVVLAGAEIAEGSAYKIAFDPTSVWHAMVVFGGNMWNFSFGTQMGNGSYASWLADIFGWQETWERRAEFALVVFGSGLLGFTMFQGWRRDWRLLIPLVWIGSFIGPTFLIGQNQIYYIYESMAGLAMLLAMSLDGVGRRSGTVFGLWVGVLLLTGWSGFIHGQSVDSYAWRGCTDDAERLYELLSDQEKSRVDAVFVVVSDPQRAINWSYCVGAKNGPMLPYLLGDADLTVEFGDSDSVATVRAHAGPKTIILVEDDEGLSIASDTAQVESSTGQQGQSSRAVENK